MDGADAWNVEFVSQIGGVIYAVAVQGNYVYIGEGPQLTILDISNPTTPLMIGKTSQLSGIVYDIAVVGNYAYVVDGYDGHLHVIDVSDPSAPVEVGFYDTPGQAFSVAVTGSYARNVGVAAGLRVVDVSNPAAPGKVGFYNTPGSASMW